jgi:hypothetical protein
VKSPFAGATRLSRTASAGTTGRGDDSFDSVPGPYRGVAGIPGAHAVQKLDARSCECFRNARCGKLVAGLSGRRGSLTLLFGGRVRRSEVFRAIAVELFQRPFLGVVAFQRLRGDHGRKSLSNLWRTRLRIFR